MKKARSKNTKTTKSTMVKGRVAKSVKPKPAGKKSSVSKSKKVDKKTVFSKSKKSAGKTVSSKSAEATVPQPIIEENKDYAVAVVATMSAGKSTLLNAMIGERLLPAQNQACTAKVFSLVDEDGATQFLVRSVKKNVVGEWQPATKETLKELNKSDADRIEIKGDLKQIQNTENGRAVLLYDTPGFNNSCDKSHEKITKRVMAESGFNSLICVLNSEVLNTNDEFDLLNIIKKHLDSENGRKIDVVFALNKSDKLNFSEGESLIVTQKECARYLKEWNGISGAMILPVSAAVALEIRDCVSGMIPVSSREMKGLNVTLPDGARCYKSCLPTDSQFELKSWIVRYLRHEEDYSKALQVRPLFKNLFQQLEMELKQSIEGYSSTDYVLIGDKFYSMTNIRHVELLSGIPVLERYLESLLKKTTKVRMIKKGRNK